MGIEDFDGAAKYTRELPYRRNTNKTDLSFVFLEECGTCSTKHALLRQLAIENRKDELKLMLGIFKMSPLNTPRLSGTLDQYGLTYIPEAHNYLKAGNEILDFTKKNSSPKDFINDLMSETEIQPDQISLFKIKYHKKVLQEWLLQQPHLKYSPEALWKIREECINVLSK
jgi:hypothetical protein